MFKSKQKLLLWLIALIALVAIPANALGADSLGQIILSPTGVEGELSVIWMDMANADDGQVLYGVEMEDGHIINGNTAEAVLTSSSNIHTSFEAVMTGLEHGKTYYYQVGSSGLKMFTYASPKVDSFSFLYMGDAQYDNNISEYDDWGALLDSAYSRYSGQLAFGFLGGDMVNDGQNVGEWEYFLNQASPTFSKMPLLAISGNHENNHDSGKPVLMNELLSLPKNGPTSFSEEFYAYDHGNAHFLALNSSIFLNEQLGAGVMEEEDFQRIADWIRADLSSSNAKWKIVVMHHPAYVVVSDNTAAKVLANWAPVFAEAGVDLVLCGHQHVYMRTYAMNGSGEIDSNGFVQVMSYSGSKQYSGASKDYIAALVDKEATYQIISVDGDSLTLNTLNRAGSILDSLTLKDGENPVPTLGDVNGDSVVDQTDVDITKNAILRCDYSNPSMDINGDDKIDIVDAHLIALLVNI